MKKILLVIVGVYAVVGSYAQKRQPLNIEEATVFLTGAELKSTARVALDKGDNEIIFSNVAGNVNNQSITVNAGSDVAVQSVTFQNNYLATEVQSPRVKEIKDTIEKVNIDRSEIQNKIAVLNEQLSVLQSNRKVSGDNTGLSVAELTKMLDLVGVRMENYLNQKMKQEELLTKTDEMLAKLSRQLAEEAKKGYQPGGQLVVKLYSKNGGSTPIVVSYVVPGAGWSPVYDIWAIDASSPLKLYYKANVYQNSGVKWENVRLTLSTGNPNEGVQAPVIDPWYLAFNVPAPSPKRGEKFRTMPTTEVTDLESLPVGQYQSRRGDSVNIGGARTSATPYIIDGVQVQSSMNNYVLVDNSGVNTSFDIDLPYTIPSDGQQHLVAVKQYDVPATYRYLAIPKLDKDAFLQAQVTNWQDLNLLPGITNIFYEGTYVGQGYIDMRTVVDTMFVSLGRDKKIVVKKEQDKKKRSVKTIGTNVKETFAYTISVRNTRKAPVYLIIQDQLPVSNDNEIVIEDKHTADAEWNETTGQLSWTINLKENETKKIEFGYTVKYPKGKTVINLK